MAAAVAAAPPGPAAGPRRFSLLAIVGGGCHRPGLLAAALQQLERGEPRPRGLALRPPHGPGPTGGPRRIGRAPPAPGLRGGRREGGREGSSGRGPPGLRWSPGMPPPFSRLLGGGRTPRGSSRPSRCPHGLLRHLFRAPAFPPPPSLLLQAVSAPPHTTTLGGLSGAAPVFVPAGCPAPPPPLSLGTALCRERWGGGVGGGSQLLHHPQPGVAAPLRTPTCHRGGTEAAAMGNHRRTAPAALCATPHRGSLRHQQPLAGSGGGGGGGSPSPPLPPLKSPLRDGASLQGQWLGLHWAGGSHPLPWQPAALSPAPLIPLISTAFEEALGRRSRSLGVRVGVGRGGVAVSHGTVAARSEPAGGATLTPRSPRRPHPSPQRGS